MKSPFPDLPCIRLERDGPVAVCLIDHPPANALDDALHDGLAGLLTLLEEDDDTRAVVLASAHASIFMAGARLEEFPDEHFGAEATAGRVDRAQSLFSRVERLPKPVVAAIAGHALGGGCELALACDFRFMSEGAARIGCPEIRLGIIPGGGGTQRLPRLVGRSRAARMLMLGERLDARAAAKIGLVDGACQDADATLGAARELAAQLAEMPSPGLRLIKRCLDAAADGPLARGLAVEREAAIEALGLPEAREGLRAFLERREPRFHT